MKKLILFAAFLSLFAIPTLAQAPLPPPPLSPDYIPKNWKEYSYPNDNVRFRFPAEPTVVETPIGVGDKKGIARSYERKRFMTFMLMVIENPGGVDLEARNKQTALLQRMRDRGLARLKERDPKIITESDVTVDGHPGRFLQVETNDGDVTRMKFFVVKNRTYFASVGVKKGEKHGINWENDFEIPAMAFLDSIHVIAN